MEPIMRLFLTGVLVFGAYMLFHQVVGSFYRSGMDIPGIDISASMATYLLCGVVGYIGWTKLD